MRILSWNVASLRSTLKKVRTYVLLPNQALFATAAPHIMQVLQHGHGLHTPTAVHVMHADSTWSCFTYSSACNAC